MGTGNFGGGSGSAGGGGSGKGASGSLLAAIASLRGISDLLTRDKDQPRLTRAITELLRDRGRSGYFKDLLSDGFAETLMHDAIAVSRSLREGSGWADVMRSYNVEPGAGSLQAFCDARIEHALAARGYDVDDRYVEHASSAFREFMATGVGGDRVIVTRGDAAAIDAKLDRASFEKPISSYLGDLVSRVVGAESFKDLAAAATSVQQASDTLAIAMYDRFSSKYVETGKAQPDSAFRYLADDYSKLVAPT
jgi:hypothetical protein